MLGGKPSASQRTCCFLAYLLVSTGAGSPPAPAHSLPQVVPTLTAAYDYDLISRVPFLRSTLRVLDRLSVRVGRNQERAPHLVSGSKGEDEAYFYLRKLGFTIVARDYRSPRRRGDIDLIGWEKDTLCFIEVKTRSRRNFMPAEAAVDEEKKNTLRALAREYARQWVHAQGKPPKLRFDVISVYLEGNDTSDITFFRDAFPMS